MTEKQPAVCVNSTGDCTNFVVCFDLISLRRVVLCLTGVKRNF